MIEKFLNASLIEMAINGALNLDPNARAKLAELDGSCISIHLDLAPSPWNFRIDGGRLSFTDQAVEQCDVRLTGTLGGFLRLFKSGSKKANNSEKLYIQGDLHVAQQFQRVMSELAPDFDTVLTRRFGDKFGSIMASALRQIKYTGEAARENAEAALRRFLESEQSPAVTRTEFEAMNRRLTVLIAKLDELSSKLKTLE